MKNGRIHLIYLAIIGFLAYQYWTKTEALHHATESIEQLDRLLERNNDAVDIGIGRFSVKSKPEAQAVVNKILNYTKTGVPLLEASSNSCSNTTSGSPFGNWRNTVCFIGDDEDGRYASEVFLGHGCRVFPAASEGF